MGYRKQAPPNVKQFADIFFTSLLVQRFESFQKTLLQKPTKNYSLLKSE